MNRLYVNGLPLEVTDQQMRELFEQFGPVTSARIIRDLDGKSLGFGMVKMSAAEDVEEILTSKDRLAVGGKRPYIWRAAGQQVSDLIHSNGKHHGIYMGPCKGRWYVFQLDDGGLRWCCAFAVQEEAERFRKQQLEGV